MWKYWCCIVSCHPFTMNFDTVLYSYSESFPSRFRMKAWVIYWVFISCIVSADWINPSRQHTILSSSWYLSELCSVSNLIFILATIYTNMAYEFVNIIATFLQSFFLLKKNHVLVWSVCGLTSTSNLHLRQEQWWNTTCLFLPLFHHSMRLVICRIWCPQYLTCILGFHILQETWTHKKPTRHIKSEQT